MKVSENVVRILRAEEITDAEVAMMLKFGRLPAFVASTSAIATGC
ncbi:MAG: hypothetical protein WB579_00525 [Bryobacteraceae bacterium]